MEINLEQMRKKFSDVEDPPSASEEQSTYKRERAIAKIIVR